MLCNQLVPNHANTPYTIQQNDFLIRAGYNYIHEKKARCSITLINLPAPPSINNSGVTWLWYCCQYTTASHADPYTIIHTDLDPAMCSAGISLYIPHLRCNSTTSFYHQLEDWIMRTIVMYKDPTEIVLLNHQKMPHHLSIVIKSCIALVKYCEVVILHPYILWLSNR